MDTVGRQNTTRVKLFAALVGGGAVVAMGALTAAMHQEQVNNGPAAVYLGSGQMTLGNTATTTTDVAPVLATEKAVPPVKAKEFGKS